MPRSLSRPPSHTVFRRSRIVDRGGDTIWWPVLSGTDLVGFISSANGLELELSGSDVVGIQAGDKQHATMSSLSPDWVGTGIS